MVKLPATLWVKLPAAKWMLEIGAIFLRTETELILKSRRVVPGRLLEAGFKFEFPNWPEAAGELCGRWREMRRHPASGQRKLAGDAEAV